MNLDERLHALARKLDADNNHDDDWDTVMEAAKRIAELEAALAKTHDHLHRLTAIIPFNDLAYGRTTDLMTEIRGLCQSIS